eukprot:TRINITY_DN11522_c0_g2_i4.p1 TRINITY_DN11522_c0_g2~~TRINITY_DN11522_c0_g2_i4.p1  ORF type:complete len:280 (+),score=46.81 TRINITY_DN11522_c0_g2_i4:68-907(+)
MSATTPKRPWRDFALGGLAACGAVTVSNPLEMVKVRMQLQGELHMTAERQYKNVFQAFTSILKKDGIVGLQKGLSVAYMTQFVLNGTRLGIYPTLREAVGGHKMDSSYLFLRNGLAGSLAGAIASVAANPFELIKTRFQAQSQTITLGHTYQYRGVADAFLSIWRTEGFRGYYRGASASAMRTCVGSGFQLGTYEQAKSIMIGAGVKDGILCYLGASLLSGLVVTTAINPFDVVRTRLFNQKVETDGGARGTLYSGPLQCLAKTIRTEGFFALYKGWVS